MVTRPFSIIIINTIMKHYYLFLASFAIASTVGAQNTSFESQFDEEIAIIPGCLTSSKTPCFITYNYNTYNTTLKIYNPEFELIKSIDVPKTNSTHKYYKERAIFQPTKEDVELSDYIDYDFGYSGEVYPASTLDELIKTVSEIYGGTYTGFMDQKGHISCMHIDDNNNYYLYEYFYPRGILLPTSYYAIINGQIRKISCYYRLNMNSTDAETLNWKIIGDVDTHNRAYDIILLNYMDYDNNIIYNEENLFVAQTLFNDDDKWEYVVPTLGPVVKRSNISPLSVQKVTSDGILVDREVWEDTSVKGFAIYNEDGKVLTQIDPAKGDAEIDFGEYDYTDIIKMGGNLYLKCEISNNDGYHDVLYKLGQGGTDIKEVYRAKTSKPLATVKGRDIEVNVDEKDKDAQAILVNMSGMTVASSSAVNHEGTIKLDAGKVPHGPYNVTLIQKGKAVQAQKILIK